VISPLVFSCPYDAVTYVDGIAGLIVSREGKNQTQLFICQPWVEVPEHCHLNVDTNLIYLSGCMVVRHNSKVYTFNETCTIPRGTSLHIRPGEFHSLSVGAIGGAFLSEQSWTRGNPDSTELDWVGQPIGKAHAARLVQKLNKTERDYARKSS